MISNWNDFTEKKSRWPTTTKIRDSKTTRWAVRLTRGWPKVTMCVESRRRVVSVSSASSKARDKNGKKLLDRKVEEVRKKERKKGGKMASRFSRRTFYVWGSLFSWMLLLLLLFWRYFGKQSVRPWCRPSWYAAGPPLFYQTLFSFLY